MDFNRQHQQNVGHQPVPQPSQPEPFSAVPRGKEQRSGKGSSSSSLTGWALVAVCVILVVFGLLWYFRGSANEASQINSKEYQAVFLTNGQVYFGKLKTLNSQYVKLTDIYYLQAKETVQPKQKDNSTSQDNNVQLVKLGNELHGPEDAMQINKDQVVFWENLKKDGKVTQAIDNYQKNGNNAANNNTAPATTNAPATPSSNSSNTNAAPTTPTSNSKAKP